MASCSVRVFGTSQQDVGIRYLFSLVIVILCVTHFSQTTCQAAPLLRETNTVGNDKEAVYIPEKILQRTERSGIGDFLDSLFSDEDTSDSAPSAAVHKSGTNTASGDTSSDSETTRPSSGSRKPRPHSRTTPPTTEDGSDTNQQTSNKQSLTGVSWFDSLLGILVNTKQDSGDSSNSGDSTGESAVGNAIVTAIAGAAVKSILAGVLG